MQRRTRPYRFACFGILALGLIAISSEVGWWWIVPMLAGIGAFMVADYFMDRSDYPTVWIATAWGIIPLLLADAVVVTGGATSPVLMWFALPAVTLGARFGRHGMIAGTVYIIALLLISTYGLNPGLASEHRQEVIAALVLVISIVVLSGALVESDWAHRRRATIDPLTGLSNRNALDQRLAELEGTPSNEKEGLSHALLLCDLDHFKSVNDRLGHAAGDAVLQDVAYTMRSTLRAGDTIYRVGGEEILVILPGAGRQDAREIANRLRDTVRERRPVGVEVTVSIGVAVSKTGPVDTEDLVSRADAALYAAKEAGRNRVVFGDDGGNGTVPFSE